MAKSACRSLDQVPTGFEIAREDLRLRGPGEFMGAKQSGAPLLRFADLNHDTELLEAARQASQSWLSTDPKSALLHARRWLPSRETFYRPDLKKRIRTEKEIFDDTH